MRMSAWLAGGATLLALAIGNPSVAQTAAGVNPTGAAVLEFQKNVAAYVKVHKKADGQVPSLSETSDPAKISSREVALGDAIRRLRADAQPGDVFSAGIRPLLIKVIQDDFKSRSTTDRKALVEELPNMKLTVNMVYPPKLPLGTVPARLLRVLPDLPPELEYRIVGRNLLLRDVTANIVVDFIRDVVPTIPG